MIAESQIQEQQCGFRPDRGSLDQFYTLTRILEGGWELTSPRALCPSGCPVGRSPGIAMGYWVLGYPVSKQLEGDFDLHCWS